MPDITILIGGCVKMKQKIIAVFTETLYSPWI